MMHKPGKGENFYLRVTAGERSQFVYMHCSLIWLLPNLCIDVVKPVLPFKKWSESKNICAK